MQLKVVPKRRKSFSKRSISNSEANLMRHYFFVEKRQHGEVDGISVTTVYLDMMACVLIG
jgi:hypothetical protein